MRRDYFAVLGLAPGRYDPGEIARCFQRQRERLLAGLHDPARYTEARQRLDELHVAYAALRDLQAQAEYADQGDVVEPAAADRLRRTIAACLEDGLLRYSRRQDILAEARRLGFSDFQAQLMIAQVQFGDDEILPVGGPSVRSSEATRRAWGRLALAGALGIALFLAVVRWLAVSTAAV